MQAVVLKQKGGPDQLRIEDVPTPQPGAGEVRVRLKSAALNRRDYWITIGAYPGLTLPCIAGSDGAGIVDAVGEGSDASLAGREVVIYPARNWGDREDAPGRDFRVLGMPDQGTFAQYICVPASDVAARPEHLSWHQAAAIPLAGLTSWRAVVTHGEVGPGKTVLVTGAGSGVSTFAILWSVALGAEVYVSSSSAEKIAMAQALGAIDGVNYREPGSYRALAKKAGRFDVIIDSAGGDGLNEVLDTLRPAGRYVFFGATLGNPQSGLEMAKLFFRQARIQGTTMGSPREFAAMLNLVAKRRIEPVLDQVMPLADAAAAHQRMASFAHSGKIVLAID